jgi:ubiquinone/menaquinone biosynthesis methyltransferase
MGNAYYDPGSARAEKVEDLFGGIASRYDLINDLQSFGLHRWWKQRLVRLAAVKPGDPVLDLCCGTGDVALRFARAGAEVVGADFSAPMLAVAEARKAKEPAGPALQFLRADALHLPFPDARFEVVTISYGLRNLSDCDAGLREMWRVLKPGGRLLVLDFGKPDQAQWRWLYFQYLRWVVPVFGRLFCRNAPAYAYILESLLHYPAQRGVDEKLRAMGAGEARIFQLLGGVMGINYAVKRSSSS